MTLAELLIALVVIAILTALAYPSYVDYVRKSRRGEAQQLLLNWAVNQEIFRSNNTAYANAENPDLPAPSHVHYTFSTPTAPTATAYALQAVAQADQANDTARDGTSCSALSINQAGTRTPAACWD